jgi:hypothetical protein
MPFFHTYFQSFQLRGTWEKQGRANPGDGNDTAGYKQIPARQTQRFPLLIERALLTSPFSANHVFFRKCKKPRAGRRSSVSNKHEHGTTIHPASKEPHMNLPAFVRRPLVFFWAAAFAVSCLQCDYRGKLVDANEPVAPLFSLKGKVSPEISSDYFAPQKSVRIGLTPNMAWDFFPDVRYDPTGKSRYNNDRFNWDTGNSTPGDTYVTDYPSVTFSGEFPLNFVSRFGSLPAVKMTSRFRAPSGKIFRLGMYGIGLFDDVDKNGVIRVFDPNGATTASPVGDQWIGVCRDYFIVYIEDASVLSELNSFITERIGGYAAWEGLKAGFNLVAFTSNEVKSGAKCYSGIRAFADSTELRITQYDPNKYVYRRGDPLPDYSDFPLTLTANYWLFFFQRYCNEEDNGGMMVTLPSAIDTVYLKTWGEHRTIRIYENDSWPYGPDTSYHGTVPPDRAPPTGPDTGRLQILMFAKGLFDCGYYSCWNPYMVGEWMGKTPHGRSFVVNGHSCADSSELVALRDTIAMEGDTLSIGLATNQPQPSECRTAAAPLALDTFFINVKNRSGRPLFIKQVR